MFAYKPLQGHNLKSFTSFLVLMLSLAIIAFIPSAGIIHAQTGTSQLKVNSQDTSGNTINGYYTVLNQSSAVVGTGFTPATFTLNNAQTYTVQVDNYGSCHFDHWADTGSHTFWRTVSISVDTTYTAVMNCGVMQSVELSVNSGNFACSCEIYGYDMVLYQNGNVVATGYSPTQFSVTPGQTYSIQADNYGSCTFYYWEGLNNNFTKANPYTFTAPSSSNGIEAVYQCNQPGLTVVSYDQSGHVISGYYTTLYDQNGNLLKAGFTSFTYSPLTYGTQYTVQVKSYGSCTFNHWQGGGTSDPLTFTFTPGSETLSAIYNCT